MPIRVHRTRDALLVVDVQPDFMPGGGLPVPEGDQVVGPIAALLEKRLVQTVVATQDWHPAGHISFASSHEGEEPFDTIELYGHDQVLWPDHCVQGTAGAQLHPGIPDIPLTAIVRKGRDPKVDSYSGFRDNYGPGGDRPQTGLAGYLRERGVERVLVCGLALDVCVAWTARDAADLGFEVVLLRDLSRPVDGENAKAELERMRSQGVVITTSDELAP